MNRLRRILRNTIISLLGQGVTWTSTLLLTIAFGHFLGATKFGELYFAMTFVSLVGIPVDYGYSNQVIRDVAQEPSIAQKYFSNVLIIKLCAWCIMYTLLLIIALLLKYTVEVRLLVAIYGFDLLFNVLVNTFGSLFYALEKTAVPTIGNILEKGLSAFVAILLLRNGAGVLVISVVLVTGSLVNAIWQAICFFHMIDKFKFTFDLLLIRELVRKNVPFLLTGIMTVGYTSIDTILLSLMANNTAVGWYGAAARISDAMNFLPTIVIMNIMYPIFAKLSITSDVELRLVIEKSVNFLLFCGIPITTIFIVAAPNLIDLLYGQSGFSQAIFVLQVLAPYTIFLYVNYAFVTALLSKKQDKIMPIVAAIGLTCNLGLNFILIPLYKDVGAAITTSVTEFLLFYACLVFTPRQLRPFRSLKVAFKVLIASLVMALVILLLHTLPIVVILSVAMLVYLGVAFLLGVIPREDYLAVYTAIRRKTLQSSSLGTDELLEIPAPAYDLPTMPIPAFYSGAFYSGTSGTLLDIQMAVTGQLPIIRLPLAPQRTGLLTRSMPNKLPETPLPSYAFSLDLKPTYSDDYIDDRFDISQKITAERPAIQPLPERQHPLKAIQLLPLQQCPLIEQEKIVLVSSENT